MILPPMPLAGQLPSLPKVATLAPIAAPRTKGWTPAKITPIALATRADARLNGLKNTIGEWMAILNLPSGRGQAFGRDVVYSPTRFRIETLAVKNVRRDELHKTIWLAENGRLSVLTTGSWEPRGTPARFAALPQPFLPSALTGFDSILKRGIAGAKPFAAFLRAATKAGYSLAVERRGGAFTELRLVAMKGNAGYEFVFAERQMLPTTCTTQTVLAGKPLRILWLASWATKPTPLTPKDAASYHPPKVKLPGINSSAAGG